MKKTLLAQTILLLLLLRGGGFQPAVLADEPSPLLLGATAQTAGDGVFLPQIFTSAQPLPAIRLCDAPAFGKNLVLTRGQLVDLLASNAPAWGTNISGADSVKISRRARTFGESDALGLLTERLQRDYIRDKGQLELQLAQPWSALVLPDEPLTLDVLELPSMGVTTGFMIRFTLRTQHETLGTWTANLRAHVWREVWVASTQLKRGDPVNVDALAQERRDILNVREPLADISASTDSLEFAEAVPPGVPLLAHMVKARTVLHRGQRADALVADGALSIKTKVEILEDGAPGEIVHARNSETHRDLTGKVLDDKTILISL
ncbi:MAG: flagellar basal body P-ring formation chaperone FlgA [Verrucomicrobiae bacterium]|nr:flagellar basal body P-ring formation chaperone FlgA [Verrucomicrobiae bacterium]